MKKVKNFDLSFTGTICVELVNGITTFAAGTFMWNIRLRICRRFCDMGDRGLGACETDRNLFFDYFSNHDANSLCFVLDGA